MYSFPDWEPVCCSMSSSHCCFLTCIQVSQEAGQGVWYSHLFKNFSQFVVTHTVKGFGVVNKTENCYCLDRKLCWFLPNTQNLMQVIDSGFPGGSEVKASAWNAGDLGSISGSGRSPGEGNGTPLQYSCLENPMDRGAWWLQSIGSQRVGHDWVTS